MSVKNKRAYADRHGYKLVLAGGETIDPHRPPAWSKIKALSQYLPFFDYMIYMDVDTLVMNMEVTLEGLLAGSSGKDVVISEVSDKDARSLPAPAPAPAPALAVYSTHSPVPLQTH